MEKKAVVYSSPDLNKYKEVYIDQRTKIFIAPDADPKAARERFLSRLGKKRTFGAA